MHAHLIREMAIEVMTALDGRLIDKGNRAESIIEEALKAFWSTRMAHTWDIYDVIGYGKQKGYLISTEDALEIMYNVETKVNSEEGINWIVLDAHIWMYMWEKYGENWREQLDLGTEEGEEHV